MATILIADDDDASRLLLTTLLVHAGHVVVQAANGRDALDSARRERLDLVITDLSMPEISGPEFIRELRRQGMKTRIALYTATPESNALRDFMGIYAVATIIPKPSEPHAMLRKIEEALAT